MKFTLSKENEWHVVIEPIDTCVYLSVERAPMTGVKFKTIWAPTIFEKLLGITLERKVKSAVKKLQRYCDKRNKKENNQRLQVNSLNFNELSTFGNKLSKEKT